MVDEACTGSRIVGESMADLATRLIRDRILDLTLPPGARIHEQELMTMLGVGRTPIREAINRISAEGLIDTELNQTASVRQLDLEEALKLFEGYRAISQITAAYVDFSDVGLVEDVAQMQRKHREAIGAQLPLEVSRWNYLIHLRLISSSRNDHLITACQRVHNQARRLNTLVYTLEVQQVEHPSFSLSIAERQHVVLLSALESKSRTQISTVLDDQAMTFRSRFVRAIERGRDESLDTLRRALAMMASAPSLGD
ncbi:GntR family transcriptional regulator [Chelativorans sp. ZYF759]|uniref:GntR family transcriptional regulator n=1 Tax=Chelativorans sp. ZYF759 TaxID=2692213 RepID=UPI00145C7AA9|nr:GntR family transcriptional regulator [Chelativorans sp. ZYF759]NMG41462.1 GntR family transcriptional regulator [Chelativorans sp. ZYF759]